MSIWKYAMVTLVISCMLMPCVVVSGTTGASEGAVGNIPNADIGIIKDGNNVKILGQSGITDNIVENLKNTPASFIDSISDLDYIDEKSDGTNILLLDGDWIMQKDMREQEKVKTDIIGKVKNGIPLIMVDGDSSYVESVIDGLGTCHASLPEAILTAVIYSPEQKSSSLFHYVGSSQLTYENNLNTSIGIAYLWVKEKAADDRTDVAASDSDRALMSVGAPYWGPSIGDHTVFQDFWPYGRGLVESKYFQLMNVPNTQDGVHWVVKYHIVGTPGCQLYTQGIRSDGRPYDQNMRLDWFVVENDLNADTYWHPNDHMEWDMNSQKYEPVTTQGSVTTTYSMGIGIDNVEAGVQTTITTPDTMVEWQGRESDQYARWWFNIDEASTYATNEKFFDSALNAHCPGANGSPWGAYTEWYPQMEINWAWPSHFYTLYYNSDFTPWHYWVQPVIY